jgi:hypothetical protein
VAWDQAIRRRTQGGPARRRPAGDYELGLRGHPHRALEHRPQWGRPGEIALVRGAGCGWWGASPLGWAGREWQWTFRGGEDGRFGQPTIRRYMCRSAGASAGPGDCVPEPSRCFLIAVVQAWRPAVRSPVPDGSDRAPDASVGPSESGVGDVGRRGSDKTIGW